MLKNEFVLNDSTYRIVGEKFLKHHRNFFPVEIYDRDNGQFLGHPISENNLMVFDYKITSKKVVQKKNGDLTVKALIWAPSKEVSEGEVPYSDAVEACFLVEKI